MPTLSKGHWPFLVVGGLVLLNMILVGLLLRPRETVTAQAEAFLTSRIDTAFSTPSASPSPVQRAATPSQPKPSAGARNRVRVAVPSARRLMVLTSDRQGWRATVGDCHTRGVIEVTNNSGKGWRKVNSPPLTPVSQLVPAGGNTLFVIGGRTGTCRSADIATYSRGQAWIGRQGYLRQSWYRIPSARSQVRAPGGGRSRPCQAALADLAAVDDRHAMGLCGDGSLMVSRNAGRTWVRIGTLPDSVAVGADTRGYVVARITSACTGVALNLLGANSRTVNAGPTRCAPVGRVVPGQVAVTKLGRNLWVWAGKTTAVSTNGGKSW